MLAASVAWGVTGSVEQARLDRERWGSTRRVVVATRDLTAGEVLDASNTALDERPVVMVPDGALDTLPSGRRADVDVPAGETLLATRLAGARVGALTARLPQGSAGVTFPRSEVQPALDVGDRVDVYASVSDVVGTASARVAESALVVHVDEHAVTIAVADDEVRDAAAASMSASVSAGVAFVVQR